MLIKSPSVMLDFSDFETVSHKSFTNAVNA